MIDLGSNHVLGVTPRGTLDSLICSQFLFFSKTRSQCFYGQPSFHKYFIFSTEWWLLKQE